MTNKQYLELSNLTLSDKFFIVTDQQKRLLHASEGLVTESGELLEQFYNAFFNNANLDKINVQEELGDNLWYLAIPQREFNFELDLTSHTNFQPVQLSNHTIFNKAVELTIASSKLMDVMKRNGYYGTELLEADKKGNVPKNQIIALSKQIAKLLLDISNAYGFKISDLMAKNIAKLRERYKGQEFDPFNAIDRDIEKELAVFAPGAKPKVSSVGSIQSATPKKVIETPIETPEQTTSNGSVFKF